MTPAKQVIIETLEGVLKSINNTLDNARDNDGMINPETNETFDDIVDLEVSQLKLEVLITRLKKSGWL